MATTTGVDSDGVGAVLGDDRLQLVANFIQRLNERRLYPLVDNKLRTKRLAIDAGIAVPELYGVIGNQHDVRGLDDIVGERSDCDNKGDQDSAGDASGQITQQDFQRR